MAPSVKSTKKATPARRAPVKMAPSTGKKVAKNASILSFFKKEDRTDEVMFLENGQIQLDIEAEHAELYESAEDVRFNESNGSVKRRKLEGHADDEVVKQETNGAFDNAGSDDHNKENQHDVIVSEEQKSLTVQNGVSRAKKPQRGPFMDDSDDSDAEDASRRSASPLGHKTSAQITQSVTIAVKDETTTSVARASSPLDFPAAPISEHAIPPPGDVTRILKHEESTIGDFEEFDGDDMDLFDGDDFEGEEFRERKFMEQQALLEAEEAGNYSCDDGNVEGDDTMTACCPICASSLAGIAPDEATRHVNACLDGNPIPLPVVLAAKPEKKNKVQKKEQQEYDEVEAPEVSRRFARAAVPRPGQANPFSLGGEPTTASGAGSESGSGSAFSKLMSGHAEDAAWASAAAAETASRGKPAYQRTCPFYKIMPGFFICVDAFRYGAVEGCKAYFLSHFHSDHYIGLTANWCHGPIYCSAVTGSLVRSQLKTAAKWVVDLDWEVPVEVPGTGGVTVTMISANHCPGSSLFLFEKKVGGANMAKKRTQRILHCGDFRACPAQVNHTLLKPDIVDAITGKIRQQTIDVCYLDTTYLSPRYSFPPQTSVINACAELCAELNSSLKSGDESVWQSVLRRRAGNVADTGNASVDSFLIKPKPNTDTPSDAPRSALSALGKPKPRLLVVCGTYSIGKERICKAIAQALNTKIFASAAKRRIVAQLGDPELTALLTSDANAAQVHMQMLMEIRADTLATYLDSYAPHFSRVVGFRPSGWNYTRAGGNVSASIAPSSVPMPAFLHGAGWRSRFCEKDLVPQRGSAADAMCFGVPYSEHSSFRELGMFLMSLRIEKVVPTVNVGSAVSRKRMKGWIDRWISERRRGGVVKVLDEDEAEEGKIGLWGKEGKGNGVVW